MPTQNDRNRKDPIQKSGFSDMLAQFIGVDDDLGLSSVEPLAPTTLPAKYPRKKEKSLFEELEVNSTTLDDDLDDITKSIPTIGDDDEYDPEFDSMIAKVFYEDENVQLRNSLMALGRQYSIKGMEEEAETSGVTRAFAKQEQQIYMLLDEINSDAVSLQGDIEFLRTARTRSYKSLADLVSAKVSMSNAKLAAIKELSAIQKAKYDIGLKLKASKNDGGADNSYSASQAIQKLLSVGRKNLISDEDSVLVSSDGGSDDTNRAETALEMARDIPDAVTDGDKFIEHETEGVEYVLDIDRDSDYRQIYAINKDGDVVENYPMPSNQDELAFSINENAGEAVDQLQRRYRLRYNGEDVGSDHATES